MPRARDFVGRWLNATKRGGQGPAEPFPQVAVPGDPLRVRPDSSREASLWAKSLAGLPADRWNSWKNVVVMGSLAAAESRPNRKIGGQPQEVDTAQSSR
jgi:hypothetical protein